ncbi:hypothetical protein HDU97_000953 [Phlyctochytrium planicorne]|nr:hypothetical protein HDU97_000953 [Phlyctochytrium planicorne]
MDTLKIRIQNSKTPLSIVAAVKQAPISSLYRGIGVSLTFSVPALSLYLTSYDWCKRFLGSKHGKGESAIVVHATAAAIAECISGFFWLVSLYIEKHIDLPVNTRTPMEVLKSKLQVRVDSFGAPSKQNTSTVGLAREIMRTEGYFITYEQLKARLSAYVASQQPKDGNKKIPFSVYLLSSGTSGAIAGGISNFVDVVKTRVQVAGPESGGMLTVVRHMYTNEGGIRAFTRGLLARVLWLAPSVTISMTVFEVLKDLRSTALQ